MTSSPWRTPPTTGADRALDGRYPPGSTFKAVSTTALLATGLTPDQAVPCPATATVDGRSFPATSRARPWEDVPFAVDFAQSCNTAFVGLSDRLGASDLPDAAAAVGIGGGWGRRARRGGLHRRRARRRRPRGPRRGHDRPGHGAGQPGAMAVAASTIARGSWTAPRLVLDPRPPPRPVRRPIRRPARSASASASASAGTSAAQPQPDAARLAVVSDLMRRVATSGTASALSDVPGAPVHAKTGTAEYGSGDAPPTHAWVIGFQGDLAFAVLVENGTSGGTTAVPVARPSCGPWPEGRHRVRRRTSTPSTTPSLHPS
ncbi:MAG: penicillin-binding transpeptidase domain-containing protein [Quadrisphaera sp.]